MLSSRLHPIHRSVITNPSCYSLSAQPGIIAILSVRLKRFTWTIQRLGYAIAISFGKRVFFLVSFSIYIFFFFFLLLLLFFIYFFLLLHAMREKTEGGMYMGQRRADGTRLYASVDGENKKKNRYIHIIIQRVQGL